MNEKIDSVTRAVEIDQRIAVAATGVPVPQSERSHEKKD